MLLKSSVLCRVRHLLSFIYTVYLFTQSDTPLVIFPMLTVSLVLAGPTDWLPFFAAFLWLELHLLAFDIKNQMIGIEEDKLCKPSRPFPSGRISVEGGQLLYSIVICLCLALSAYHGLLPVSFAYMLAILLYNEAKWSYNPIAKSPLGAIGYMCYCWGTTYIIGKHQPLTSTSLTAIVISGLIFTTTGHTQDFRDRSGDAAIGRRTLPLILPQNVARWTLLLLIMAWTYGLILFWKPPVVATAIFSSLATIAAFQFVRNRSEEADRKAFRWYELWLIFAHLLPIFERLSNGDMQLPIYDTLA